MTGRPFRSRANRPPSLNLSFSGDSSASASASSSPRASSRKSSSPEPESEEEASSSRSMLRRRLSTNKHHSAARRPLSMTMGPYCPQRPSLADVLSNTAPPPYTLSAFMAYLSQNHCLETLEFTMDASRYRKHYDALVGKAAPASPPPSDGAAYVRMLWQKLLDAYIMPNGPREVNLPCTVRDRILSFPCDGAAPPPDVLDPAIDIVTELMEESVLMPFLNECAAMAAAPVCSSFHPEAARGGSDDSLHLRGSLDDRLFRRRAPPLPPHRDPSPPLPFDLYYAPHPTSQSYSPGDARGPECRRNTAAAAPFSTGLGWISSASASAPAHGYRHSTHFMSNSWASSSMGSMVEDSGISTTTSSAGTPMTPPTTPPMSEHDAVSVSSAGGSPKLGRIEEKGLGWKKITTGMGRGLVWGKKKRIDG